MAVLVGTNRNLEVFPGTLRSSRYSMVLWDTSRYIYVYLGTSRYFGQLNFRNFVSMTLIWQIVQSAFCQEKTCQEKTPEWKLWDIFQNQLKEIYWKIYIERDIRMDEHWTEIEPGENNLHLWSNCVTRLNPIVSQFQISILSLLWIIQLICIPFFLRAKWIYVYNPLNMYLMGLDRGLQILPLHIVFYCGLWETLLSPRC